MTMRITGLASGLDTDSMIQELVKASSTKKDDLVKAQTKLGWKQEIWKEFNTKVYDFYNDQLTNMMLEGSYIKKKTTISDESIADVISGSNVVNGTQTLSVKQLARAGALTGAKLSEDKSITAKTSLFELTGGKLNANDKISLRVTSGGKETTVELGGSSTIEDVVKALNNTGIKASFDEGNQRIFLQASDSGAENDFSITAGNLNGLTAMSGLGLLSKDDFTAGSAAYESYHYWDEAYVLNGGTGEYELDETIFQQKVKEEARKQADVLLEELAGYKAAVQQLREDRTGLTSAEDRNKNLKESEEAQNKLADAANVLKDYYKSVIDQYDADLENGVNPPSVSKSEWEAAREGLIKATEAYTTAEAAAKSMGLSAPSTTASYNLTQKVEAESREYAKVANTALHDAALQSSANGVRVKGQDSIISLNGAEFTSNSNSYTINGMTITAKAVSAITGYDVDNNPIYAETTITTMDDTDGIYDMIKNFFTKYNELIKEMDTKYNADSSKGYEPLTDDEKDAMSETEVEKWETKIKDSLLRRDSDLGTLINIFKTTMLESFTIDGKKYSLSSFGINTMGYFLSGENEKGVFHIDGDADDSTVSSNENKLKAAIASDPQTVTKFFTQLIGSLQKKVNGIMQRTDYRSMYNVYDNKRMQTEYDDYKDKIKEQEKKLQALEDRYYNQFSQMETALSKLNSQQSYLTSLFGG